MSLLNSSMCFVESCFWMHKINLLLKVNKYVPKWMQASMSLQSSSKNNSRQHFHLPTGNRLHLKAEKNLIWWKFCSAHKVIKIIMQETESWKIPTCIYKANECLWCTADDPRTCHAHYILSASQSWEISGRLSLYIILWIEKSNRAGWVWSMVVYHSHFSEVFLSSLCSQYLYI